MSSVAASPAAVCFPLAGRRIWVTGHTGMVGGALVRRLADLDCHVLTAPRAAVDLTRQAAVEDWMAREHPDVVIVAAAKVGGIHANDSRPAEFIHQNLAIATTVIHAAHVCGVRKLLYLGSSCLYPRLAPQPMTEDALLTGPLEPTNQWYAVAKIAGLKMCQAYRRQYGDDFIAVMPTNLYGPGDTYDHATAHVPAALIRRFHEARLRGDPAVVVWGTGTPRREFLCVDDLADACVFVLERWSSEEPLNVGTGEDVTIATFAAMVAKVVGYDGRIVFDPSRPDGAPRKLLDVSRLGALGWRARTPLESGLRAAYADFLAGGGR
ncbi:GDP-L-fucose synthase family protein [Caenispirillum bisanense]|uniref:GDP-L-fucose synthase n=1 Tax=Caenispirillum bisanense TaxID=414052 RepID=A0A286GRR0_9PROT|nr:GDP-L-fucose synthase [Caenispirillum bisanense]SOD98255.1 GDP-L-fucose synthase [Caenispirillum bisanense]